MLGKTDILVQKDLNNLQKSTCGGLFIDSIALRFIVFIPMNFYYLINSSVGHI